MERSLRSPQPQVIPALPPVHTAIGVPSLEELLRLLVLQLETAWTPPRPQTLDEPEPLADIQVLGRRYAVFLRPVEECTTALSLSPREREIVRLVARGLPNKTIATLLEISQWTVATHLRRIFGKLEVNSRAEMVARALQEGLLAEEGAELHRAVTHRAELVEVEARPAR